MLLLIVLCLMIIGNINSLKISNNNISINKLLMKSLIMITIFNQQPSFGDNIDSNNNNNNDISMIVPSRKTIIKLSDEDINIQSNSNSQQIESFDEVLKLIPSWKYFKIIAKEYRY